MRGLEEFGNVQPHHGSRNHTEIRKGGVAAADARDAGENLPEFIVLGHLLHFRTGIGYGDEMATDFTCANFRFDAFEKVLLEDIWLERATGFARNDAKRLLQVELFLDGFDLRGIGRIEDVHFRKTRNLPERHAENFRAETRTAHAKQNCMLELSLFDFGSELLQRVDVRDLLVGD